ncbi:MAG: hypothetical protein JXA21_09570 [Anaerolineae bacterium]|nr:hypothetical protein [Anaerolineae bacterium]
MVVAASMIVLSGLWMLIWSLRLRILTSPDGLGFRAFDTWRTTWDNIDCVLVTPYGLAVVFKAPLQPEHEISNVLGPSMGGKTRLMLMYHMSHWPSGLEEDFKQYAPGIFEDKFKSYP